MKKQPNPPPSGERPPAPLSNECDHKNLEHIRIIQNAYNMFRIDVYLCTDCNKEICTGKKLSPKVSNVDINLDKRTGKLDIGFKIKFEID